MPNDDHQPRLIEQNPPVARATPTPMLLLLPVAPSGLLQLRSSASKLLATTDRTRDKQGPVGVYTSGG
jgi:hypothetical protein